MSGEKLSAIQIEGLVRRHLPRGWRLIVNSRLGGWGQCNHEKKTITLARPLSDRTGALVFLHEVGHARCHGREHTDHRWPRVYVREYEAEKYALTVARNEGIVVPRWWLLGAKLNVASYFPSRGRIDPKIQKWVRS